MASDGSDGIEFDVWGSRGSHNIIPAHSEVGNDTSCYSVRHGEDLFVLDAGRGLLVLGYQMERKARFKAVRRVHVLVTHAHLDHWEGLKDVDWFWRRGNGLEVTVYGSKQALDSIRQGFAHPSYVPLEILARGTVALLRRRVLSAGVKRRLGSFDLETFPLHHYSGGGRGQKRYLDTIGYRLSVDGGPCIAYLSDHEPTPRTRAVEERAVRGAHLAVFDSHFKDIKDQMFGHGSQEHSANVARRHPQMLVLAGHIGPMYSDREVFATFERHARGAPNFRLALEGVRYRWDAARRSFERVPGTERL